MRGAHLLARRADVDAALPVEPVRTGAGGAVRPAQSCIELSDELQEAMVRGVEVPGELGDLVRERPDLALTLEAFCIDEIDIHIGSSANRQTNSHGCERARRS